MRIKALTAVLALGLTACGGGDSSDEAPPASTPAAAPAPAAAGVEFGMPDWMQVDNAARTVTIHLVAGLTDDNNRWELQWVLWRDRWYHRSRRLYSDNHS